MLRSRRNFANHSHPAGQRVPSGSSIHDSRAEKSANTILPNQPIGPEPTANPARDQYSRPEIQFGLPPLAEPLVTAWLMQRGNRGYRLWQRCAWSNGDVASNL